MLKRMFCKNWSCFGRSWESCVVILSLMVMPSISASGEDGFLTLETHGVLRIALRLYYGCFEYR